jgi:hypothetical protein
MSRRRDYPTGALREVAARGFIQLLTDLISADAPPAFQDREEDHSLELTEMGLRGHGLGPWPGL